MSTILLVVLIAYFALSAVIIIAMIGRRREPITHSTAIIAALIDVAFIVSLLIWGN